MADRSIVLEYNQQGELKTIGKIIGDKELIFGFDGQKAVLTQRISFKDRCYSSDDLWVPRPQFIAAFKQATAIFRSKSHHS